MEARGGDKADEEELDHYIENGSDSLQFWRAHLDLQEFLPTDFSYDYTTYRETGALRGNSWQMKACMQSSSSSSSNTEASPTTTCGSKLQRELLRLSEPIDEILEEALSIVQLLDGSFLITTNSTKLQAVCVILRLAAVVVVTH